jgi:hypothetical protein
MVIKVNATNTAPFMLEETALKKVESFVYLVSIVDKQDGKDADVKTMV